MDALLLLVAITIPFGGIWLLLWLFLTVRKLRTEVTELQLFASAIYNERPSSNLEKEHKSKNTEDEPAPTSTRAASPPNIDALEEDAIKPQTKIKTATTAPIKKPSLIDLLLDMRILIWIGGVAMALGGIFIAKYSIEQGLLGPWGRMVMGLLTGIVMLGGGEWLRRQPENTVTVSSWFHMPLAVAGAGFTTLYGVIFASFALYELFPPTIAIMLMALVAALGLAYSILLGPTLALLALIGAYLVPALVSTEAPSTEMLFLYLGLVMAGSFILLRFRPWFWLGTVNLVASVIWYLLWITSLEVGTADILVVSFYFAFILALYVYQFGAPVPRPFKIRSIAVFLGTFDTAGYLIYSIVGYVAIAGLLLVNVTDYNPASFILILAPIPLAVWLSERDPLLEATTWITHSAGVIFIALWPPLFIENEIQIDATLIVTAMVIALFYIGVAAWRIGRNDRGFLAAWNALASPLLMFCLLYWKYNGFGEAPEWSLIALFIAAGFVAAVSYFQQSQTFEDRSDLMGVFAIGVTAGLSLGFATVLKSEWLTIAFALEIAAIGWIYRKIRIPSFRPLAALLVIIVIVRLELDSEVFGWLFISHKNMDWYLYGFGLPILGFAMAYTWFKRDKNDYLIQLLESGLVLFWVTLLTLSLRDVYSESFTGAFYTFAEGSILVFSLLANALGLYWLSTFSTSRVREWSWKILLTLGLSALLLGPLFLLNPLYDYSGNIGDWYGINWLSFGFIVPAVILVLFGWLARNMYKRLSDLMLVLSGILGFFYINAEIRHVFAGDRIAIFHPLRGLVLFEQVEIYSYSVCWLLYAGAIMGIGIGRGSRNIRQAALLLLLATVLKVFLYDTAALDGLYRAASFLGLGGCLIGLAFLYQRFGREAPVVLDQG